jgi:hypothetical protein
MSPREQFDGLVREFAGQIVSEVLRASLADVTTGWVEVDDGDSVSYRKVSPGRPTKRRNTTLTPKRRAALKVQGRYLGLLRRFSGKRREHIKKTAAARGTAKAIVLMEALRGPRLPKAGSHQIRVARSSDDLLPTNQAADYIVISRSAFRERIAKGLIKPTEVRTVQGERARYFSKDDLRRHVAKHPVRDDHRHGSRKAAKR